MTLIFRTVLQRSVWGVMGLW